MQTHWLYFGQMVASFCNHVLYYCVLSYICEYVEVRSNLNLRSTTSYTFRLLFIRMQSYFELFASVQLTNDIRIYDLKTNENQNPTSGQIQFSAYEFSFAFGKFINILLVGKWSESTLTIMFDMIKTSLLESEKFFYLWKLSREEIKKKKIECFILKRIWTWFISMLLFPVCVMRTELWKSVGKFHALESKSSIFGM